MEIEQNIQPEIIDDGGGGEKPTPPTGYKPTTPQQRSQWNSFLDNLKSQGNIDLNDPKVGANFLEQYRKNNPNFTITADQIPFIQYEQQQIRKGDSFNNLSAEQLNKVRMGMSPNFLNISNVYQSYYPQFKSGGKDYGTDMEGYLGGGGEIAKSPETPNNAPVPSAAPANDALPQGAIPRPDYTNFKSRLNYVNQLSKKYGKFVDDRHFTITKINDIPDGGSISAKDAAIKEAQKQGLDPALFYSSTMEEGANGLYPDKNGEISAGEGTSDNYPISGFGNYGLDNFHGDFKTLVKKGYLPKDFDYEPSYHKNENGDRVPSANFKTPEDAVQAKAAYVRHYSDQLNEWAKGNNVELSPTAKQFFTLVSFNGGPGTARKLIKYYQQKGLLKGDKFLEVDPGREVDRGDAYNHIHDRFLMANLLKKEGYFR